MPLLPPIKNCPFREYILVILLLAATTAKAQLTAGFMADKNGGCSPLTVSFTNTTTGASSSATYSWNLGNGNVSLLSNPGSTYINEQTYTITLTVKDGAATSTSSQTIIVYKKPIVDFATSPAQGCVPLPVNFTSTSTAGDGGIINYFWDFGDGATQQGAGQITHTYNLVQTASVGLTVTNSYGCYNTLQKPVVVLYPAVKAGFTTDRTILCQTGNAVQFTNTSSGGSSLAYTWNFGDGATAIDKDPSHVYTLKGVYTVTLSILSPGGCSDISTQTTLIHVADFTTDFAPPSLICQGVSAVFQDLSTPQAHTSLWHYPDANINTSNGTPAVYTPGIDTGIQTLTLTNTYAGGCQQSVSRQIDIHPAPQIAGFLANEVPGSCGLPVTVAFADTCSTAVKWQWNFDPSASPPATSTAQQSSYTYRSEGYFSVGLTVTNAAGCSSKTSKIISTYLPSVFISWVSSTSAKGNISCGGFTMGFNASSNSDSIVGYKWNFGDGGTSTDAQPLHHFTIPGTYIIYLNYTTKNGCQGVAEYSSVHLYQMPVADFSVSPGTTICGNNPAQFTDLSQGPISDWHWDFGDNGISTIASPTWRYGADGLYTITLIVRNELCSDTLVRKDYITVLPPFFQVTGPVNTCDGTRGLVTLNQKTVKGVTWNWDFGDGSNLLLNTDQEAVQHIYTRSGTYTVSLTVSNGTCSIKKLTAAAVLLKQNPQLTANMAEMCASDVLQVNIAPMDINPYYDLNAPNYSYTLKNWQWTDQSSFAGSYTPGGIYHSNNYYAGTLQGLTNRTDSLRAIFLSYVFGCYDTSNYIPLFIKGPSSGYQVLTNNVCFKLPVVLQDMAHGNNNSALRSWTWNFGDGQTETLSQGGVISHYYPSPGTYTPVLTVADRDGCSASSASSGSKVQVTGPKAIFSYAPEVVSPNTMVYFYNSSNTTGVGDTHYQWSFGDGSLSIDPDPSHSYSSISKDTVRLIAQSASGQCADTAIRVIDVKTVHTSFSYTTSYINNNSCPPVVVQFTNASINAVRLSWDFGDGSSAENQTYPTHTYYQPGVYRVVLVGYSSDGGNDSTIDSITVKGPYAKLQADTLSGCTGQTVTLSARVMNASSFTWDFADGTLDQTQDTFAVHSYLTGGLYAPALLLKDQNGCSATSVLDRKIIIDSLQIGIKNKPPYVCDSTLVLLTPVIHSLAADQLQQPLQYKWDLGTGLPGDASTDASASYTYWQAGLYHYHLWVSSPYGCIRELSDTLRVVDPEPLRLQVPGEVYACMDLPLTLQAAGAASYNWIHATGLDNDQEADPVARPPLQASYTVVGYDAHHCFTDTATVIVTMTASPTVNAGPDIQVLTGSTLSLNATGSADVTQWNWSPPDGLSCTDCASPVCTPRSSALYIVTGKTQYGCPASDTVALTLICDEGRVYIPNSFTPNGDGKNEVFYIKGKGIRIIHYLRVYNRWGEIVFQHSNFAIGDVSAGWDGTYRGNPVETGAYVYLAEMVCDNGEVFPVKGSFLLIR